MTGGEPMTRRDATKADADLLLDLYVARREDRLRQARDWYIHEFHARTVDDFDRLCPRGSEANDFFRMVVSYWDMAASMVRAGLIEQTLFFKNNRELLFVWERAREVMMALREAYRDPLAWHNLEAVADAYVAWLNEEAPGAYEEWKQAIQAIRREPQRSARGA